MDDVVQAAIELASMFVYGDGTKRRHVVQRAILRTFVLGGFVVVFGFMIFIGTFPPLPIWVAAIWAVGILMMIAAEHWVGQTALCFAVMGLSGIFVAYAITLGL